MSTFKVVSFVSLASLAIGKNKERQETTPFSKFEAGIFSAQSLNQRSPLLCDVFMGAQISKRRLIFTRLLQLPLHPGSKSMKKLISESDATI